MACPRLTFIGQKKPGLQEGEEENRANTSDNAGRCRSVNCVLGLIHRLAQERRDVVLVLVILDEGRG